MRQKVLGACAVVMIAGCAVDQGDLGTSSEDLGDNIAAHSVVHVYLTSKEAVGTNDMSTTDKNKMIVPKPALKFGAIAPDAMTIRIDDTTSCTRSDGSTGSCRYQTIDGFGATISYVSASILQHEAKDKSQLLSDVMSTGSGIGISILRESIGANGEITDDQPFSYDDNGGSEDPNLKAFSVEAHDGDLIASLGEAITKNPDTRIIATPWSPPAWMKSNHIMYNCNGGGTRCIGHGHIQPPGYEGRSDGFYPAYANYLADYVAAYERRGIKIWALTPQNEPGNNVDFPGMDLSAEDEAKLIAQHLAPALDGRDVRILGYDWNFGSGGTEYALGLISELKNEGALKLLDGVAFHCYGGDSGGMTTLHDELAKQGLDLGFYVTECTSADETKSVTRDGKDLRIDVLDHGERIPDEGSKGEAIEELIASMRNYAKVFVTLNLVHHPDGNPHLGNGCNGCIGLVTVDPESHDLIYERDYAYMGHASKFVTENAFRVDSNTLAGGAGYRHAKDAGGIENVAFLNTDGTRVLVVYNSSDTEQDFQVEWPRGSNNGFAVKSFPKRSVATFTW